MHVYTVPGKYDVTLIATLVSTCADTLTMQEFIELEGPIGNFALDINGECLPVDLDLSGTSAGAYQYIWDFGNGVLDSTEARVFNDISSFTYYERGSYIPRLILIDTLNCRRALSAFDTVHVFGDFLEAVELSGTLVVPLSLARGSPDIFIPGELEVL